MRNSVKNLSAYTIAIGLFLCGGISISNAQNIDNTKYETYKKSQPKTISLEEDLPVEVKLDIENSMNIKYLKNKTNSKYEVAYAHSNGTYSYISKAENLDDAIKICETKKNIKSNDIPVVINEDGLVVYATEGIGRIVKIINGVATNSTAYTAYVYKNKNLTSPEHTYINHAYIDDVPIIEDLGDVVKVEVSGYTGYMKKQENDGSLNIITVPINQAINLSYYSKNSNGELIHTISSDITTENKSSSIVIGKAPSFMKTGTKYYSYDGMYFYTDISKLMSDVKQENHNNSVNSTTPYYNYYIHLPARSKTSYTADEINTYIKNNTSSTSVLRNTGKYFIEGQSKYGVNAMTSLSIAMNESARGESEIAKTKFNVFGLNAEDSYPQGAKKFDSVGQCITSVANNTFSNNYFNPKSWKYNNSNLGNKSFGMNVRYASDPYWSEKAAKYMYAIDKDLGMKDYEKYSLGVYTNESQVYNKANEVLYKILGANNRKNIYGSNPSLGQVGDTAIILSKNNDKYEIQPDRGVPVTTQNTKGDGTYIWDKTGYVNSSSIKVLNASTQNAINRPTDYKGHWAESVIDEFIDKGYISGYSDNTFRPNNSITRAEFVSILNNVFGLTKSSGKVFSDTKTHWAKTSIDIGVTNGVCSGKSSTEFKPNDPITREEAAVMISNYKKIADSNFDKLSKFKDAHKVSSWAKPGVEGIIEKGYMSGYSDNTFRPKNKITRAEAVATLSRIK